MMKLKVIEKEAIKHSKPGLPKCKSLIDFHSIFQNTFFKNLAMNYDDNGDSEVTSLPNPK